MQLGAVEAAAAQRDRAHVPSSDGDKKDVRGRGRMEAVDERRPRQVTRQVEPLEEQASVPGRVGRGGGGLFRSVYHQMIQRLPLATNPLHFVGRPPRRQAWMRPRSSPASTVMREPAKRFARLRATAEGGGGSGPICSSFGIGVADCLKDALLAGQRGAHTIGRLSCSDAWRDSLATQPVNARQLPSDAAPCT